jgi:hypothetical protein
MARNLYNIILLGIGNVKKIINLNKDKKIF